MLDPVGFWSYARLDDAHSDGQLSLLRAIVGKAIGLQYGAEAAPGSTTRRSSAPRNVPCTTRTSGTARSASGWPER